MKDVMLGVYEIRRRVSEFGNKEFRNPIVLTDVGRS
jgi:hypothetical protein